MHAPPSRRALFRSDWLGGREVRGSDDKFNFTCPPCRVLHLLPGLGAPPYFCRSGGARSQRYVLVDLMEDSMYASHCQGFRSIQSLGIDSSGAVLVGFLWGEPSVISRSLLVLNQWLGWCFKAHFGFKLDNLYSVFSVFCLLYLGLVRIISSLPFVGKALECKPNPWAYDQTVSICFQQKVVPSPS